MIRVIVSEHNCLEFDPPSEPATQPVDDGATAGSSIDQDDFPIGQTNRCAVPLTHIPKIDGEK